MKFCEGGFEPSCLTRVGLGGVILLGWAFAGLFYLDGLGLCYFVRVCLSGAFC